MIHHIISKCEICNLEEEIICTRNEIPCGNCGKPTVIISDVEVILKKEVFDEEAAD